MSQQNPEAGECCSCGHLVVFDHINDTNPQACVCPEMCCYWTEESDDARDNECECWVEAPWWAEREPE
jgi:hypothetical protein